MLALRAVSQKHQASGELLPLLEEFRRMVNVCITVGMEENISSLKTLSSKAYHRLTKGTPGYYRFSAVSTATGILRNYRKAKRENRVATFPYARKLMLRTYASCGGFKIQDGFLRLSVRPRAFIHIKLNSYTLQVLSGMTVRSVTVTPGVLSISYSKEVAQVNPEGYIGVDRNLDNVTIASTDQRATAFDLSKVTRIKSTYRYVTSRFRRNDSRIRQVVYSKYGLKQRNRVQPLLHDISKRIVSEAKNRRYGIVMERLTNIRRLYRKGNGQSTNYRAKMNSWSYGELQRQIEYKARWEGVRVIYIPARNTSKRCSICGYKTLEGTQRKLWCPNCGTLLDRDENAARNIAAGGMRFSPDGPPVEAMVEEREPMHATLIPKVDGGKSSLKKALTPS